MKRSLLTRIMSSIETKLTKNLVSVLPRMKVMGFTGVILNLLSTPRFLYLPKTLITENIPADRMEMAITPDMV